ncbi:hypothetical protein GJW-30_1_00959 [Variibacter gotjawalensis]|uniref:Uncharacterized protein n=1 Tax=Variibacter gotjawalensis TaxID=1333996 RepID=A0A0S3PR44_9BRAD|nr:hypothetical protein [Variibacter gotjawalensis]NIK48739.1 hypothetical protein [Variibacter gotjawalensis]RZS50600.1 hypothetical protein EV661_3066 [Variibacter gotjawalensis]BAT58434.1 hypothetical protein GJW-30_1_00959 [Variibacter gotjawalensis]
MTDKPKPDPVAQIPESQTFAQSAMANAQKAGEHFAGRDPNDPADDAIELWGRRIGRGLSLLGVIGLAIYLFVTYILK